MGKVNRADVLRSLLEDAEGYSGRDEWREEKKQRNLKSLHESNKTKGRDKRRAYKLQRAIRRGEFDPSGSNDTKSQTHEDYEEDEHKSK